MNLTPEQLAKINDPNHPILVVIDRMTKIEEKMKTNDPEISTHLKEIWKHMQQYEELAHLLTPQQIGVLMAAMQKHVGVQLVSDEAGKKTKSKSKKVSVNDLI
jgi:hypothetical protein